MICYNCFRELNNEIICPNCGYNPSIDSGKCPHALEPGSILNGRYIIGRVIGQGGFGITYIALDYISKERVAIKEFYPEELASRSDGANVTPFVGDRAENFYFGKESFLNEAKTLAQFRGNAHIVCVQQYFEENGTAYLVMEYVEGIGLDSYMNQHNGRISVDKANTYLLPIMDAMSWVHSKGVVHRDIAPDNILITKDDTAKLIDFGAARYSTGEKSKSLDVVLKHGFAPFEQYSRHGKQGPFTDVYALAATYYYAITGKIPPDSIDRINKDQISPPSNYNPDVYPEIEKALLKGLEPIAENRFQTMSDMKTAFASAITIEENRKETKRKEEEKRNLKEQAAEKKRIASLKAAEEKRLAAENAAECKRIAAEKKRLAAERKKEQAKRDKEAKNRIISKEKKDSPNNKSHFIRVTLLVVLLFVLVVGTVSGFKLLPGMTVAYDATSTQETIAADNQAEEQGTAEIVENLSTNEEDSIDKVEPTILKCALSQTIDNPEAQTLLWISDQLYDATEGRYFIEVFPSEQLGDQASSLETCMAGGIEMTLVANAIVENYSPDFAIVGTPYIYDSLEHQEKVFESGCLDKLFATTESSGFTVLSAYSLGSRNLYTRDGPVTTPEDLKGLKVRVMGSKTGTDMMDAMGGISVAMSISDVYNAIQVGIIDGAETDIITYTNQHHYEVAPYYNYTGHLIIPDELCINTEIIRNMSVEDQDALKRICKESQPYFFQLALDYRASYEKEAKEQGVIFSECDVAAFQNLCEPLIAEKANLSNITKEVYESILSLRQQ